jgi:hypothetical protein
MRRHKKTVRVSFFDVDQHFCAAVEVRLLRFHGQKSMKPILFCSELRGQPNRFERRLTAQCCHIDVEGCAIRRDPRLPSVFSIWTQLAFI